MDDDSTPNSWISLAFDSWILGMEAGMVMWLRSLRLMAGGALAEREARRMISEKVSANAALWPALLAGGIDQSAGSIARRTLSHYAAPVRANQRRLSRRN